MASDIHANLLFPDPFKPAGLEFDLPEPAVVSLTITDADGITIASHHQRVRLPTGHHELRFRDDTEMKGPLYANLLIEMQEESVRIIKHL